MKKSCTQSALQVIDGGAQVEAQVKALAPIAVAPGQDAKALERANDLLDTDPNRGMQPIDLALLATQLLARLGLEKQVRVSLLVLDALIALVEQAGDGHRHLMPISLKQHQIVRPPRREGAGQDLPLHKPAC